ncbi:MAG: S41 family peptidase [Cyclobacteriaceae bacterium]
MSRKPFYFLAIVIGICSCHSSEKMELTLNGTWNSLGYGRQINISDDTATFFDIYSGGCSYNKQWSKAIFKDYYEVRKHTSDSLTLRSGFTDYTFVRPSLEPQTCRNKGKETDPLTNFDALWNTFNENYVSFGLREVNWLQSKTKYRSRLSTQSTDLELYAVLEEMTFELQDGHVWVDTPDALKNKVEEEEGDTDELRTLVMNFINSKYVAHLKTYNHGVINWGVINQDIGYIQINDFEDLASYDIDPSLSGEAFWEGYREKAKASDDYRHDALSGMKAIMSEIFEDIGDTQSCIIDVRFNGGGYDQAGLEVLSYFTPLRVKVFSKKARFEDGFTSLQDIYLEPNGKNYDGNLYLLTSFQTASASEAFIIASQSLPNVTTIGSNTEGILSDILSKKLPNGWKYGLSNEIYESINGINYERVGIPPDYELNYNRDPLKFYTDLLEELKTNDRAIEKVVAMEATRIGVSGS